MAAGGAAAAIANAIKASGVLVSLEPEEFAKILNRAKDPLVVTATAGFFGGKFRYLFSYKGLAFTTVSATPIMLPAGCEVVSADGISIPG
jgi:hypothetical protein